MLLYAARIGCWSASWLCFHSSCEVCFVLLIDYGWSAARYLATLAHWGLCTTSLAKRSLPKLILSYNRPLTNFVEPHGSPGIATINTPAHSYVVARLSWSFICSQCKKPAARRCSEKRSCMLPFQNGQDFSLFGERGIRCTGDVRQHCVVDRYRSFVTAYRYDLQGLGSRRCPETSVPICQWTMSDIPEVRIPQLHLGGSHIARIVR